MNSAKLLVIRMPRRMHTASYEYNIYSILNYTFICESESGAKYITSLEPDNNENEYC